MHRVRTSLTSAIDTPVRVAKRAHGSSNQRTPAFGAPPKKNIKARRIHPLLPWLFCLFCCCCFLIWQPKAAANRNPSVLLRLVPRPPPRPHDGPREPPPPKKRPPTSGHPQKHPRKLNKIWYRNSLTRPPKMVPFWSIRTRSKFFGRLTRCWRNAKRQGGSNT